MKRNSLLASLVSLLVAFSAHATVYDLKLLFDTDRSEATGCTITLSSFSFAGVEQVVDTRVEVAGGVATTLGVTRQACTVGLLGSAIPVDSHSWPAGITPAKDLFIETHVPLAALGMTPLTTMRIGMMITDGTFSDAVLAKPSGRHLLYPEPGRRRAVVPTPSTLAITLDGLDPEWIHVTPVAGGGEGAPDLRWPRPVF